MGRMSVHDPSTPATQAPPAGTSSAGAPAAGAPSADTAATAPEAAAPTGPPPRKSNYQRPTKKNTSLRNMLWALSLTLGVVVIVAIAFFGVGSDQSRETLPNSELDIAASAERAQAEADFRVIVPQLGEDWIGQHARFSGGDSASWEIRYTSPQGSLVTLVEQQEVSAPMLSAAVPGAVVESEQQIEGAQCQVLRSSDADQERSGIACQGEGWGFVAHGSGDVAEIEELAAAAVRSAG